MDYSYEGLKYSDGAFQKVVDQIVVEVPLEIRINDEVFSITMQTPGHEQDLVKGLLYAEDISRNANLKVKISKDDSKVFTYADVYFDNIELTGYLTKRSMLSVASCGICGQKELTIPNGNLEVSTIFSAESIQNLYVIAQNNQDLFKLTGGSHSASAFNLKGELLVLREDIGRHNAVDKVVGSLLTSGVLKSAFFLLVSGRISYEIITKCFKAGIPVIAAVSAPSSLAIDFAKELGVTLLAFCRDGNATCYSHPERIKNVLLED